MLLFTVQTVQKYRETAGDALRSQDQLKTQQPHWKKSEWI